MPLDAAAIRQAVMETLAQQPPGQSAQVAQLDKSLYHHVGLPVLIGGNALDLASTEYALSKPGLKEGNGLLANRGVRYGLKAGGTALEALLFNKLAEKHPKLATGLGIAAGAVPALVGLHNLSLAKSR